MIEDQLHILGFREKESKVYLYLIEYGISGASEVAHHLGYPKSTVNFLADALWKRGYLTKSIRGNTHYYEADIWLLESILEKEILEKRSFLQEMVPILQEKQRNIIAKPKIHFLDGVENCKQAYLELLKSEQVFYEFWSHADLVKAFGSEFMKSFIRERVRRGIFCDSIGITWEIELELQKLDHEEKRNLKIFHSSLGIIGSSIAIYNTSVLVLNLEGISTGVRIENREFAETMKTIFRICKGV